MRCSTFSDFLRGLFLDPVELFDLLLLLDLLLAVFPVEEGAGDAFPETKTSWTRSGRTTSKGFQDFFETDPDLGIGDCLAFSFGDSNSSKSTLSKSFVMLEIYL